MFQVMPRGLVSDTPHGDNCVHCKGLWYEERERNIAGSLGSYPALFPPHPDIEFDIPGLFCIDCICRLTGSQILDYLKVHPCVRPEALKHVRLYLAGKEQCTFYHKYL